MSRITNVTLTVALFAWAALPAHADDENTIEEIVVSAHPLSAEGLAQPTAILQGEELAESLTSNIGTTLEAVPGVRASTFGLAAGRPVIHGLGGPRVRIMEDRIDALDVSVTSADHAVSVDPFVAERIEVLKGPSTLLYGTGAIGGVVDVHTGRIPHTVPDESLSGGFETRYDSNTEGNATAAKLNGGTGNFAWHFDISGRDGDVYDIPGFAESAALRAAEEEEHDDGDGDGDGHDEEEEEVRGRLPGSQFEQTSVAGGVSYVGDWGFVGIAVSSMEADYGLPGGHGHEEEEGHDDGDGDGDGHDEEEEEEGNPILDLKQTRVDLEMGVLNPFANFTAFNLRLGVNDYEHQEIEPSGEIATLFENDAWELRGELTYELDNWRGAFGLQHMDREFSAVGEEAFIAPVDTTSTGVFWVGERSFDGFDLETGLRLERVEHDPSEGSRESFNTYALSLGVVRPVGDNLTLGAVLDLSSRAPVGEELFANGPHLATNTFEIGDPTLDEEQATSLSVTLNYTNESFNAVITAYYTQFSDFIFEAATGDEEDELPVFVWQQTDADFFGIDDEVSTQITEWDNGGLVVSGLLDLVNAELDDSDGNDNLPRLPPLRLGVNAAATWGPLTLSTRFTHVTDQDKEAEFELPTDSYNDWSVTASYTVEMASADLNLFVRGKNLTDDEQRDHTSFIKDFAPRPGRSVEAGLRLTF